MTPACTAARHILDFCRSRREEPQLPLAHLHETIDRPIAKKLNDSRQSIFWCQLLGICSGSPLSSFEGSIIWKGNTWIREVIFFSKAVTLRYQTGWRAVRVVPRAVFRRPLVLTQQRDCGFTCDSFDCKTAMKRVSRKQTAAQLIMTSFPCICWTYLILWRLWRS